MGGEYYLGTGLAELLELAEEAIELHCALEGNLHAVSYTHLTLPTNREV